MANSVEIFDTAVEGLVAAIRDTAHMIKSAPYFAEPANQGAGLEHLVRTLYQSIDRKFWQDEDFPLFHKLDFRSGYGGDSPDQQYLQSFIRGGETYRIWGHLRAERMIDVRVYAGLPWSGGKVVATLLSKDLQVGADGTIEIIASPERRDGNWLENPPGGTEIMVRQIGGDWVNELPGEWHIDLVGHEGDLKPVPSLANKAALLNGAADWLRFGAATFLQMMECDILSMPVNTLAKPLSAPVAFSRPDMAAKTKLYQFGHFELQPDEALVITIWPLGSDYQGIALNNMWFFNSEYANRQSTLSDRQSAMTEDGAYHYVVAHEDPGAANWLDTMGLPSGLICLRYEGVPAHQISAAHQPRTRKVKLAELRDALPVDALFVDPARRAAAIAARRLGIQLRNGQ